MPVTETVLALDISGSRALLAWIDPSGAIVARGEVANPGGGAEAYFPRILHAAEDLCEVPPAAIGVAFGGPVGRDGRILSIHVGGWSAIDPAAALAVRWRVPVVLENDANCGAVGEATLGGWGRPETLVFLTCSTGIGGGIVGGGQLFRGSRGLAGELGHLPLDPTGPACPCGSRGCLEVLCSGTAIGRRATAALDRTIAPSELSAALVDGKVPGAEPVFRAAAAGDRLAKEVLAAVSADFGRGIGAIQNAIDPDLIVIGGGVSLAGARLTEPVAAAARPWIMASRRDDLRLETAALGLEAQLLGAGVLAWRQIDHGSPL